MRQAVVLERAEKQQAAQAGVSSIVLENVSGDRREDLSIVAPLALELALEITMLLRPVALVFQNGPVEVFLPRKMPEDNGLVHMSPLSNMPRRCPFEALLRKQLHGGLHDLPATLLRAVLVPLHPCACK